MRKKRLHYRKARKIFFDEKIENIVTERKFYLGLRKIFHKNIIGEIFLEFPKVNQKYRHINNEQVVYIDEKNIENYFVSPIQNMYICIPNNVVYLYTNKII